MKLTHMTVSAILAFVAILAFISVSGSQSSPPGQNQSSQSGGATNTLFFRIDFPRPDTTFPPGTIIAKGNHNYDTSQHIWIVLSDGTGYYLQNPEVRPSAVDRRQWKHSHVCLGRGIRSIIAVLVTENGNRIFQDMVYRGMWGQFMHLPEGTRRLADVSIIVR